MCLRLVKSFRNIAALCLAETRGIPTAALKLCGAGQGNIAGDTVPNSHGWWVVGVFVAVDTTVVTVLGFDVAVEPLWVVWVLLRRWFRLAAIVLRILSLAVCVWPSCFRFSEISCVQGSIIGPIVISLWDQSMFYSSEVSVNDQWSVVGY